NSAQPLTPTGKLPAPIAGSEWRSDTTAPAWGFTHSGNILQPFVSNPDLAKARETYRQLLFPEKQFESLDPTKTVLFINNDHSIAGRNPVRVVLFPKNTAGEEILLARYPSVTAQDSVDSISIKKQHESNGMLFIDLENSRPQKSLVTVEYESFKKTIPVYFAPNCKSEKLYCLTHPIQAWWYMQTIRSDKKREQEAQKQKAIEFGQ
ncbi:hypothetical protein KA082_03255, partial [Candidatus Woesebacteria bacterium]|nr:hypothetical protein [Candidatus Woesebacteria bacterium]